MLQALSELPDKAPWVEATILAANLVTTILVKVGSKYRGNAIPEAIIRALQAVSSSRIDSAEEKIRNVLNAYNVQKINTSSVVVLDGQTAFLVKAGEALARLSRTVSKDGPLNVVSTEEAEKVDREVWDKFCSAEDKMREVLQKGGAKTFPARVA